MSDYLWDRSGAPDPEVERLEALLGELRGPKRELEMPDGLGSLPEGLRAPVERPRRSYRPLAVVAAAALALTPLLWWGMDGPGPQRVAFWLNPDRTGLPPAGPRPDAGTGADPGAPFAVPATGTDGTGPTRRRRPGADEVVAWRASDETELEGRAAKEQLMLALHITGAKLQVAHRRALEVSDNGNE